MSKQYILQQTVWKRRREMYFKSSFKLLTVDYIHNKNRGKSYILNGLVKRRINDSLQRSTKKTNVAFNGQEINFQSWVSLRWKRNLIDFLSPTDRQIWAKDIIIDEWNEIWWTVVVSFRLIHRNLKMTR